MDVDRHPQPGDRVIDLDLSEGPRSIGRVVQPEDGDMVHADVGHVLVTWPTPDGTRRAWRPVQDLQVIGAD